MLTYLDESIAQLKHFEGCVPWMHLGETGDVTVGAGVVLPDAEAACALPFRRAGAAATPAEIAAEYARVRALEPGQLPGAYRGRVSVELSQATINDGLAAVVNQCAAALREKLPQFEDLPQGVKLGLLDMACDLGPEALFAGHAGLIRAVESAKWGVAAAESERMGQSAERNAWTRQQLLSGVVASIREHIDPATASPAPKKPPSLWSRLTKGSRK